jgi:uncharacterized RDD family membrane protein YckC
MRPVPYAHFHQRVLAQLLDIFLLFALFAPILYLLNNLVIPYIETETVLITYRLIRFLLVTSSIVYAFAICLERFGATPGKMLLGLKVLDMHTGEYLNRRQAALRILLSWLSVISSIGVLLIILDSRKQAAHDKILHTIVIKLEDDYACMELPDHWRHLS